MVSKWNRVNLVAPAGSGHFIAIFISILGGLFVVTQILVNPASQIRNKEEWSPQPGPSLSSRQQTHPKIEIPPPISPVIQKPQRPVHHFTVPALQTYYQDLLPNNHTKLYLDTSGIMMLISKRNFTAAGCMVGDDVYRAFKFKVEAIQCHIPRLLRPGERIVPVLLWDDVLNRAMKGPVTLSTDVVAELHDGDITELPKSAVLRGTLASLKLEDLRLARSDVTVGPSDNFVPEKAKFSPRYRLCLMTMIAPSSEMLKDWADYHRRIGVDFVYIFDNGAALDLHQMFAGRLDVEIVDWPFHKSQRQAVNAFVFAARARCERVQLEDSDEYPMLGLGHGLDWRKGDPPLIRYVKQAEEHGFDHLKLIHLMMTNSGFQYRPDGEVPMNFVHRKAGQSFRNGKSICKMDFEWDCGNIHQCGTINGRMVKVHYERIDKWGDLKMEPEFPEDPPFLVHYTSRSWQEFVEKWDAGRVSGKQVADKAAGTRDVDKPLESYLRVNPEMEYTYFRDMIYSRVLSEGTLDEQTVVQIKDGLRCETLYNISNSERKLVREVCS